MKRSSPLLLVLVWLLIVLGASAVTWFVIDSTGRDLFTRAEPTKPSVGGVTVTSPANPSPVGGSPRTEVRNWQGLAGTVAASCQRSRIALRAASPSDGWSIEVDRRGPREVRVEFETGAEDDRRTRVRGRCSGGVPVFAVDSD